MNIELDEASMEEYANQRAKQVIDQKVRERLKEIQWYRTVDNAVFEVVRQEITSTVVKDIISKIDRNELIKQLSEYLSENIVDKIFGEYS